MMQTMRSGLFWLLGWRSGRPASGGTYLIQMADGRFGISDWWLGGKDWASGYNIRYWKKLRGPIQ